MARKGGSQLALFPDLPAGARGRRPSTVRSFFALWPDPAVRAALALAAAQVPPGVSRVHRVKPERYHLTLAFLGDLEPLQIEAAAQAGDALAADGFCLSLDRMGHFFGPNVVWIGPAELPRGLVQLKASLDRELLRFGLPVAGGGFVPHVTCLRGMREAPDAPPVRIEWQVRDFVLVRTVRRKGTPEYKVVRRWPLQVG